MNQHYLDVMFPVDDKVIDRDFLDTEVEVEEDVAIDREGQAIERGYVCGAPGLTENVGEVNVGGDVVGEQSGGQGAQAVTALDRSSMREGLRRRQEEAGRVNAEESKGKTVRDLSRLWKYRGGGDPDSR